MNNLVYKIICEIRDFINNPRTQYLLSRNRGYWNQLCSSLDVIQDCELAINSYANNNFSTEDGEKYLRIYGLLQAAFVQQDAVTNLWESLQISGDFELGEKLKNIRKIRNESIGHPTKIKNNSYHFISRVSMEKSGFKLISCYNNKTEFNDILLIDIIKEQETILSEKLKTILQYLKNEEKEHKEKFKMKKLESVFPETFLYSKTGLFESVLSVNKRVTGELHLGQIKNVLDNLKIKLKERGIELDTYDYINMLYNELEYPITELENFFNEQTESKINDKAALIFTFFIEKKMDELKTTVNEIDKEYDC